MLPSTRKLHLKVVGNTKKFGGGEALADQEMGPGWSINSSIMSPEINLKCTQKQPTTKNPMGGSQRPPNPQLLNSARCARHIFTSKLTLRYTLIKAFRAYTKIIPGYAPDTCRPYRPISPSTTRLTYSAYTI